MFRNRPLFESKENLFMHPHFTDTHTIHIQIPKFFDYLTKGITDTVMCKSDRHIPPGQRGVGVVINHNSQKI